MAVLLLVSLPAANQAKIASPQSSSAVNQTTIAISQSSTSTESESTTITAPCNAPGTYCGPGFVISNASLISASTLGENYSLLNFNVNGTYSDLRINSLTIWLANANFSEFSVPDGGNGPHLVGKVIPSWGDKDGAHYSFNVPTTGFTAVKGVGCQLWIDAYSVFPSPLRGDNWAEQNVTMG